MQPIDSNANSTKSTSTLDADQDTDNDTAYHDDDLNFGHSAATSEIRAAGSVVRRYYATAAADRGGDACGQIFSPLARQVPLIYGRPPGPPSLRGKTCATVMSKLLRRQHDRFSVDFATLQVTGMLIEGDLGLVFLRFKDAPHRHLFVRREHGTWKIDELLDGGSPQYEAGFGSEQRHG